MPTRLLPFASAMLASSLLVAPIARAQRTASDSLASQSALIRDVVTTLASPRFEGRGTGQPGGERAAAYIAERFKSLGASPGGDGGTYFQTLRVAERVPLPQTSLTVANQRFLIGRDFGVAEPPPPFELRPADGDAVFVGYGVVSPDLHRDDLAGLDVDGKIVVLLDGSPANVDRAAWQRDGDQRVVVRRLVQLGARGLIVLYAGDEARFPFSSVAAFLSNRTVGFTDSTSYPVAPARWSIESLYPAVALPPALLVGDRVANALFAAGHLSLASMRREAQRGAFVSRTLPVHVAFDPRVRGGERTARNVIARIEGSDPALRSQVVVYTAHYDAYGIDPRGTVFPGAADNALGVGKLLAIVSAFATRTPRPRRSIVFIASTGEEYGDIGTAYWLHHPTCPLERVAADINLDGSITEVWGPLGFIINYSLGQSDIGPIVREAAARHDVAVIPDPMPEEDYFTRGDHWAFVRKGIPSVYLVGGPLAPSTAERAARWVAANYHMPSDSVHSDWNWSGSARLAQLAFEVGQRLATHDELPQWRPASKYNHPRGTDLPSTARPGGT